VTSEAPGSPVRVLALFGVAGSGKTTVGRVVAEQLAALGESVDFLDADAFHSETNRAKMRAGIGLDEADRRPWLDAVRAAVTDRLAARRSVVLACSALRRSYRDRLGDGVPVRWFWLDVPESELVRRLVQRRDHFAGPALLVSQRDAFEEPAAAEAALRIDASRPVPMVAADVIRKASQPGGE
jgi:gluconokinase